MENKNVETPVVSTEISTREIKVKKGDTLDKIARRNKVKVSEIIKINNLSNSFLKIGQVLQVPSSNKDISKTQKTPNSLKSSTAEYYTIKVGDNPYTIAIKHSIKPNELLKLNNLDDKRAKKLKPGDKLRIR